MTAPFDSLAAQYRRLWSDAPAGRFQRSQVWRHIGALFQPGDRVLDLGCGIGDDALRFAARGVRVFAIDASKEMVEAARARGVDARLLALENLDRLEGAYSGAISNFGVLNCVPDLPALSSQLARLVRPEGPLALCVMGRFAPLDWRHALSRWSGRANWRGIPVYYRSCRQMRAAFASDFAFRKRVSIGWGDHQLYLFRRAAP
ncbi:MAG TPA: class I SAM-dependent methyltransferase [Bryobacteraceae bacterium]|nr:class I SAM-dependent methyltransferase [Bryobacteraceae bacterium]